MVKNFVYRAHNPVSGKKRVFRAKNIDVARRKAKKMLKSRGGVVRTHRLARRYQ